MQTHDKPVGVIVRWNALWASTEQRQDCAEDGTGVCFSLVCPALASAALTHVQTLTHILQHTPLDYDSPPLTHLLSHRVLREAPERASGWIGALRRHRISFLTFPSPLSWGLSVPSLSPCPVYSSFQWVFVQPVPPSSSSMLLIAHVTGLPLTAGKD